MKKNVLVVIDYLELGGATRSVMNIIEALSQTYNIYLLSGELKDSWTDSLLEELKPFCKEICIFPLNVGTSNFDRTVAIFWATLKAIIPIKKKYQFEFILVNLPLSGSAAALCNLFINKTKILSIFHGSVYYEVTAVYSPEEIKYWSQFSQIRFYLISHLLHKIQAFVVKQSTQIICFSVYSKNVLIDLFHLDKRKVSIIFPPIPIIKKQGSRFAKRKKYGVRNDVNVVVIASRIEPRKGIEFAIEAAHTFLQEKNKKATFFYFIGPAFLFNYFMSVFSQVADLEITNKVVFWGPMKHSDLQEFLSCADLLLMPSVNHETLGIVTLESLSQKVPVIGFNSGASPEILNTINSHLIAKNITAENLATSIDWYLSRSTTEKKNIQLRSQKAVLNRYTQMAFLKDMKILLEHFQ